MRRLLPLPFLLLAAGPALAAARQATNWPAVMSFGFFVVAALYVSKWAAAKSRAAADVYAVGGGLSGFQNGLAIAGDYMSAASFLGISAAVMVYGYDGLMYSIGFLVGWPIVTFLMAERLRNLGKFTFADVAGYRFRQGPIRAFAAVSTLIVVAFYLVAQMVGAGHLIRLLFGLEYWMAVLIVGALMMAYVLAGGMSSTTWVQIIKAVMLLAGATFMAFMVLLHFGFSPEAMFARAIEIKTQLAAQELRAVALDAGLGREAATVLGASGAAMAGRSVMAPGNFLGDPLSAISFGIALMCGTAGLPHVLIRFFTVPNAKEARKSVFWATTWIGYFYLLTIIIGFGAIAFVLTAPEFLDGEGQLIGGANMAAVNLARAVGGNLFFGFIAAVAFATILAVVAGLTLSGTSAVSHDLYATLVCRNGIEADTEVRVSRLTTLVLGLVAVVLGIAFEQQNIAYLVSLAFAVAASANFPVLFMAVLWRDCTTRGAVVGGSIGLATSLLLVVASPAIWEEVLGHQAGSALFPYASPCLFSMAAGFAGVWLFSRFDRSEQAQRERLAFRDQEIRSETGIGVVSARVR